MTAMTLVTCVLVLATVVAGVAVLPWSDQALEESEQSWKALWAHITGTAPAGVASPAHRVVQWVTLSVEPGLQPPRPDTVWSPPAPQRRCA